MLWKDCILTLTLICFIPKKDHEENFENKPSIRLINPAKNDIGRFNQVTLEKINVTIKSQFNLNQSKNTKESIDWFVSIDRKPLHRLVQFDIKEFYLSVRELLLEKALKFAEEYIDIPTDKKAIIKHAWKSCLFKIRKTWMKKIIDCLTQQWLSLTEQQCVNLSAASYTTIYVKSTKERISFYTVKMD